MNKSQVIMVVKKYATVLDARNIEARRDPGATSPELRASHVRWMCDEVQRMLENYGSKADVLGVLGVETESDRSKLDKAMRWLGFIQGVFAADGIMSVEQMKEDNR